MSQAADAAAGEEAKLPEFAPLDAATLRKRKFVPAPAPDAQQSPRFSQTLVTLQRLFTAELEAASVRQTSTTFRLPREALKKPKGDRDSYKTAERYQRQMEKAFPGVRIKILPYLEPDSDCGWAADLMHYDVECDWSEAAPGTCAPCGVAEGEDY